MRGWECRAAVSMCGESERSPGGLEKMLLFSRRYAESMKIAVASMEARECIRPCVRRVFESVESGLND